MGKQGHKNTSRSKPLKKVNKIFDLLEKAKETTDIDKWKRTVNKTN